MRLLGACALLGLAALAAAAQPAPITIDYPEEGSIFPPEITAPTFLWRDTSPGAARWRIEISFGDGSDGIRAESPGLRPSVGEIDPRCVAATNELPKLSPQQAASWAWTPDASTWTEIKKRSVNHPATVAITGYEAGGAARPVSAGKVSIRTSKDPVGAPVFYRDVPLMPSEPEKGIIKPLDASAVPLIAWRLRNIGEPSSRLLMEGLHTCANCHSFSRDGKTLGMDLDGPKNDKGMYALVSLAPRTVIRNEDVVTWSSFKGRLWGDLRVAFMSQVSPDGSHVVTTVEGLALEGARRINLNNYYVANFKDYRFLQVFYPTRGILAWYSREKGVLQPLPGTDDPAYVHTDAVWSPDSKYLIFARAEAKDPYPANGKTAGYANDPSETQIRYDLYRIPFNDGKGGKAEPISGASHNGMSNSFPKVSPDGRWIVFVQARNGQLMRPDSRLYIVPVGGGEARLMRANTPLMNSWHSFSPNGRWLVFSSKSRSPYTQMFLTHIDESGQDSPAILIDNATAANRAVNIPEFVNIPPDGLVNIDAPAVEYYRLFNQAWELARKGQHQEAIPGWRQALELNPVDYGGNLNLGLSLAATDRLGEAILYFGKALEANPGSVEAHNNLALALDSAGRLDEAIAAYRKALEIAPGLADVHLNLGVALARTGKVDVAVSHFEKALELDPKSYEAHNNLGIVIAGQGKPEEAIARYRKALEINPDYAQAHNNLGLALVGARRWDEAITHLQRALEIQPAYPAARNNLGMALTGAGRLEEAVNEYRRALEFTPAYIEAHANLADALFELGRFPEALEAARRALALATRAGERSLEAGLRDRIGRYEAGAASRKTP